MPITQAVTASKKAGAPAPHSTLADAKSGDYEMDSDLSSLSDNECPNVEMGNQEMPQAFPLKLRDEGTPSDIVCIYRSILKV